MRIESTLRSKVPRTTSWISIGKLMNTTLFLGNFTIKANKSNIIRKDK